MPKNSAKKTVLTIVYVNSINLSLHMQTFLYILDLTAILNFQFSFQQKLIVAPFLH